jgi:hypothetical protein
MPQVSTQEPAALRGRFLLPELPNAWPKQLVTSTMADPPPLR